MNKHIQIPEELCALSSALCLPGQIYLVGGGVRNALLGLPGSDYDITGPIEAQKLCELAGRAGYQAVVRSSRMGTVEIKVGSMIAEYTTFRMESYPKGGGHHPDRILFTTSLEKDARRRDFTVNALYADLSTGQVIDPLHGLEDLSARQLTACRKQAEDTLKDDGLRLLRLARFAGELGFSIDPSLMQAARTYAQQIHAISQPRIWGELSKIVIADSKYGTAEGHVIAMDALVQSGVLFALIPELREGAGVAQSAQYHAYDVLNHNLATYAASRSDSVLRWAALLHDVGKPRALDQTGRMIGHDEIGAALCGKILPRLGADCATQQSVQDLVARHMFDLDGMARTNTVRKRFARWGFSFCEDLICLRRYDIAGSGKPLASKDTASKWSAILAQMKQEGCVDNLRQLKISGQEIMQACGIGPSPLIGKIKQALFDQCAIDPAYNRTEQLIKLAPQVYKQLIR